MTTSPIHPVRGLHLALLTAAVIFGAVFGFVPRADAGVFTINACQADRASFATVAFDDRATRGMLWRRACNPLGPGLRGLVTSNVARKGRVARGAYSAFVLDAPPGTVFSEIRWSGHARRRDCRYALQLYAIRPGADPVAIRNIRANRNCPRGSMAQASGWPTPRAYGVDGATRIVQRTICVGAHRPGRRFCSARGRNYIRTFTAEVTVADPASPAVSVLPDSPLARGEWVSGVQSLGYDASDNTGVRLARAVVSGVGRELHFRHCNYAWRVPCEIGPGHIPVDTRLPAQEGSQPVQVLVEDAAGNQAVSEPVIGRIDNTPPGAVPVEVEGGEGWRNRNGFDIGWVNPPEPDRAPIITAHYTLCDAIDEKCLSGSPAGPGIDRIEGLQVPGAGEWQVRMWREDAAQNQQPANASVPVWLRYDPEPPSLGFEPSAPTDPTRVSVKATDRHSGLASGRIEIGQTGTDIWHALPTSHEGEHLVTRIDDAALPPGEYALRAAAIDNAGNQAITDKRIDGSPMRLGLPVRVETQITAGILTRRVVRRIQRKNRKGRKGSKGRVVRRAVTLLVPQAKAVFGKKVKLSGQITTADGQPLTGALVHLYEQPRGGTEQLIATLTTDEQGRFTHELRATASGSFRFAFPGSPQILPVQEQATLLTRARSSLSASRRRVLNGRSVAFSGKVHGRPLPAVGKLVEMQVRLTEGWQTFRTTRTDPDGAWQMPYRFTRTCGTQRFTFRARLPAEAGYPLEAGKSPARKVIVKGQPCTQ